MFEKVQCLSKAFTLAEVLIVLGIIGLIADMTIPTLHQGITEKVAVTKLRKVHSTLESAFRLAVSESDTPENWNLIAYTNGDGALNGMHKLTPHLNLLKDCGLGAGCFYEKGHKQSSGVGWTNYNKSDAHSKILLSDGTSIALQVWDPACTSELGESKALKSICGLLDVDINGKNPPNALGVDTFTFYLTKFGIIPLGTQNANAGGHTFDLYCKDKTATYHGGYTCAAWVIYNENMDYLHCNDLSWSGKKKCN